MNLMRMFSRFALLRFRRAIPNTDSNGFESDSEQDLTDSAEASESYEETESTCDSENSDFELAIDDTVKVKMSVEISFTGIEKCQKTFYRHANSQVKLTTYRDTINVYEGGRITIMDHNNQPLMMILDITRKLDGEVLDVRPLTSSEDIFGGNNTSHVYANIANYRNTGATVIMQLRYVADGRSQSRILT